MRHCGSGARGRAAPPTGIERGAPPPRAALGERVLRGWLAARSAREEEDAEEVDAPDEEEEEEEGCEGFASPRTRRCSAPSLALMLCQRSVANCEKRPGRNEGGGRSQIVSRIRTKCNGK